MAVPASGAIAYNSVTSLFSVINASDITQSFNFGTSNTLSVIHNCRLRSRTTMAMTAFKPCGCEMTMRVLGRT